MSIIAIYLIFSMLAVIVSDASRYIIPNWLTASLVLLYPIAVYMSPQTVDWKMALAAMGATLVIGYAVFALRLMGAGDIKLLVACALWVGWEHILAFIFMVALLGGLLSLILWVSRKALPLLPITRDKHMPRLLREGEPVPYGLAIATTFLLLLRDGSIAAAAGASFG